LSDKKILVKLPEPHLLSYELKIDKMETANRKGWFLFQDDETYTDVQKKLYQTSREQLENNQLYLTQSKDKITKIIKQYYQPFLADHQLEITFDNTAYKTLK
jgi:dsDNA-binding SOS-regulon protein